MTTPQVVIGTEINHWLLQQKGIDDIHPMQELIWTKVSNVLGDVYPSWPSIPLSDDQELDLQKSFFDYMWDQPLKKIIETLAESRIPSSDFIELSEKMNQQNKVWAHEMTNIKAAYDIELRGVIEAAASIAVEILRKIVDKEDGWPTSKIKADQLAMKKGTKVLLYNGFKDGDAKYHIRSLHIYASIHAAMRRDRRRQFNPNDFYDFQHATAALAYCDGFFTEKALRDLVTRKDLDLEAINGCKTISKISEAVNFLRAIC